MEYKRYRLGDLITQRREKYEGDDIPTAGISREGFMPPKQIEADTSIYNVFYLNDFVFNPARMELNSIVFNDVYPKAICSSLYEMFYVHRTDVIMPEYLNLYVKRDEFARHCEFLGSGSAREYCRVANISEIELDIPSLEEQKKIVRQYKTIMDRIGVLEKINEELEKVAKISFKEMVFDKKDNLPEGWRVVELQNICDIKGGKRLPAGEELQNERTAHPYIRVRDVGNSRYTCLTEDYQYITDEIYRKIARYIVKEEDIIISIVGTIGLIGKIHKSLNGANLTENCMRMTNIREITPDFIYYTLSCMIDDNGLSDRIVGAVQAKLPMYNIETIPIIIPDEDTINKFVEIINGINRTVETQTMDIQNLYRLKNKFLANIF